MLTRSLLVLLTTGIAAVGWLIPRPTEAQVGAVMLALLGIAILQLYLVRRDEHEIAKGRYAGRIRR